MRKSERSDWVPNMQSQAKLFAVSTEFRSKKSLDFPEPSGISIHLLRRSGPPQCVLWRSFANYQGAASLGALVSLKNGG